MLCLNCPHYDFNDYIHGYGTCEPQNEDFRADHECTMPADELRDIESLILESKNSPFFRPNGKKEIFFDESKARRT